MMAREAAVQAVYEIFKKESHKKGSSIFDVGEIADAAIAAIEASGEYVKVERLLSDRITKTAVSQLYGGEVEGIAQDEGHDLFLKFAINAAIAAARG